MIWPFVDVFDVISARRTDRLSRGLDIDPEQTVAENGISKNGIVCRRIGGWNEDAASTSAKTGAVEGNKIRRAGIRATDDIARADNDDSIGGIRQGYRARDIGADDVAHNHVAVGRV